MTTDNNEFQGLKDDDFVKRIIASDSNDVVSATLRTDDRVIARVTDGIYRQPGSAIRELISNAYDADASRVVIKTDAPRFERISVEDNGIGMSPESLAHMLLHIGGSAKRQNLGKDLGITNLTNSLLSPGGRKLIGKIGIGIFSVSQLTHTFQIITKTKGDKFRTIASVAMKQYSDDTVSDVEVNESHEGYESGKVLIWREKASDIDAQGTTIVLTSIKPQARDTLRSKEIWEAISRGQDKDVMDEFQSIDPPKFHIGQIDASGELLVKVDGKISNLPWESSDKPEGAFKKLVQSVWDEQLHSNPNPSLEKLFDYYLQMIWQLSLSIPAKYVDGHLFDTNISSWKNVFCLNNQPRGSAVPVKLTEGKTLREELNLQEGLGDDEFEVLVDDLKLSRPIRYKGLPNSDHAIKNPLIFIGKCKEEFSRVSIDLSAGPLEFEVYLFWTPKVLPTEHRGSLIRINGSSGTLFDPSFMRYQVSELTRLRQITCEIFIQRGFDSALNIDRESFNYSHPHSVYLMRWLHSALRQLATAQKRVANEIRTENRSEARTTSVNTIQKIALDVWHEVTKDIDSMPPSIAISEPDQQPLISNQTADLVYNRSSIFPAKDFKQTAKTVSSNKILDEKIKAIAQVLASFGLLDSLSMTKQERLLRAIYEILETSE
jgi:hypothetical protein